MRKMRFRFRAVALVAFACALLIALSMRDASESGVTGPISLETALPQAVAKTENVVDGDDGSSGASKSTFEAVNAATAKATSPDMGNAAPVDVGAKATPVDTSKKPPVTLVTYSHSLKHTNDASCVFIHSAIHQGFTKILFIGKHAHSKDKMRGKQFRNHIGKLWGNLSSSENVIFSDFRDVFWLRSAQEHLDRYKAFIKRRLAPRPDTNSSCCPTASEPDAVVLQGDQANFCNDYSDLYASHYKESPVYGESVSKYIRSSKIPKPLKSAELLKKWAGEQGMWPYPNTGFYMGSAARMEEVINAVFKKDSGIDQGWMCVHAPGLGLLGTKVHVDAAAELSQNYNVFQKDKVVSDDKYEVDWWNPAVFKVPPQGCVLKGKNDVTCKDTKNVELLPDAELPLSLHFSGAAKKRFQKYIWEFFARRLRPTITVEEYQRRLDMTIDYVNILGAWTTVRVGDVCKTDPIFDPR